MKYSMTRLERKIPNRYSTTSGMPLAGLVKFTCFLRLSRTNLLNSARAALDSSFIRFLHETNTRHKSANRLNTAVSSPSNNSSGQKQHKLLDITDVTLAFPRSTKTNQSINSRHLIRNPIQWYCQQPTLDHSQNRTRNYQG